MNCELWLWLYLWEIWWFAYVAKCIGQQCPAIRIEGTMREFVMTNTLKELSPWPKMNTCELWNFIVVVLMYYHNVSENMEWMNSKNLTKWTCVVRSELAFAAINCVVCSESVFTAESVLSAVNQHSLPKLCCLQRISVHCRKCVVCSKSAFATDIVLSATNSCSLLKEHCLQRINVRC